MYIKDSWSCQSYGMYNNNRGILLYVCLLRAHLKNKSDISAKI